MPEGSGSGSCVDVPWPAGNWKSTLESKQALSTPDWYGSLAIAQRDDTGNLYRRNRYFDPTSGQFTQPDPIGLAGGINLYRYGDGDPVNFSDPFGLSPCGGSLECVLRAHFRRVLGSLGTSPESAVREFEDGLQSTAQVGICVASGGLTVASGLADVSFFAGSSAGGLIIGSGARQALSVVGRESAEAGLTSVGLVELRSAGGQMAEGATQVGGEVINSTRSRVSSAPASGALTAVSGGNHVEVLRDAAISLSPVGGTFAGMMQTASACRAIGR